VKVTLPLDSADSYFSTSRLGKVPHTAKRKDESIQPLLMSCGSTVGWTVSPCSSKEDSYVSSHCQIGRSGSIYLGVIAELPE
jgi:hypothetical protein